MSSSALNSGCEMVLGVLDWAVAEQEFSCQPFVACYEPFRVCTTAGLGADCGVQCDQSLDGGL